MQKLKKLVALLLLCTFFAFSSMPLTPFERGDRQAAHAQQNNTIVLEMSGADKDDIADLRNGEGKLFKKLRATIEELKESGTVDENAQPVVAIVQKKDKSSSKGLLD